MKIPVVFSGVNYPNISPCSGNTPTSRAMPTRPITLRTIRMIESIMGKSRICLMNGLTCFWTARYGMR